MSDTLLVMRRIRLRRRTHFVENQEFVFVIGAKRRVAGLFGIRLARQNVDEF